MPAEGVAAPVSKPADADPFPVLSAAVATNSLVGAGKVPFHLKFSFELFDLNGKQQEEGTLESWWAGPDGQFLDLSTPSLGVIHNLDWGELPSPQAKRSLFLIDYLLSAVQEPYGSVPARGELISEEKKEKTVMMDCMHVVPEGDFKLSRLKTACFERSNKVIRFVTEPDEVTVRNRLGTFAGTSVALDVQVLIGGKLAIKGKVEKLEGFKAAASPVTLEKPESAANPSWQDETDSTEKVLARSITHKQNPEYPLTARRDRIAGTVWLLAKITKNGKVADIVPAASPDALLTKAAMDAVKDWTYTPYLLNGAPTEVNTSIKVTFNISSSVTNF